MRRQERLAEDRLQELVQEKQVQERLVLEKCSKQLEDRQIDHHLSKMIESQTSPLVLTLLLHFLTQLFLRRWAFTKAPEELFLLVINTSPAHVVLKNITNKWFKEVFQTQNRPWNHQEKRIDPKSIGKIILKDKFEEIKKK